MSERAFIRDQNWEDSPSAKGINHLLAIGIDQYKHCSRLKNAVRDAEVLCEVLQHTYRFEAAHIHTLFDEAATRAGIWKTFGQLKKKMRAGDNLLIYYAGHGSLDENGWGYWIPVEAAPEEHYQFLRNREVVDWIKALNCHHLMLISDSCFSGSFFSETRSPSARFSRDPSRWALPSGRRQVVTDGERGKGSPFNQYLIKYLQNNQGPLLFSQLANKVKVATNSHAEMYQTPQAEPLQIRGHEGGEFVFLPRRDEAQDWKMARATDSRESYSIYLSSYPQGSYAEEAHWQMACIKDTPSSYRAYLEQFGQGRFIAEAIERMEACKEREAFHSAMEKGEPALWRYLIKYPKGTHRPQAQAEIQRLKQQEREPEAWRQAQISKDYKAYLKDFPDGAHAAEAEAALTELGRKAAKETRLTEETQRKAKEEEKRHQVAVTSSNKPPDLLNPPMAYIEGGDFQMGCTAEQKDCDTDETEHTASVSSFYMGKYEVSFKEYDRFCEATGREKPSDEGWGRGRRPVINIDWYGALEYCNWLSQQQGLTPAYTIDKSRQDPNNSSSSDDKKWLVTANWQANGFRLPTEAEWEYAARQRGQAVLFGNGKDMLDPKEVNFDASESYKKPYSRTGTYRGETVPVGSLNSPNSLDLHDMSGNVWEWCWDWYADYPSNSLKDYRGPASGRDRVYRGGSWGDDPQFCRLAYRSYNWPSNACYVLGFRLARIP